MRWWWIRLLYTTMNGSLGTVAIYRAIYFQRVGLTGTQIGILVAMQPLLMRMSAPLWSMLADRGGIRSHLLTLACGLSTLSLLGMLWMHGFVALLVLTVLWAALLSLATEQQPRERREGGLAALREAARALLVG